MPTRGTFQYSPFLFALRRVSFFCLAKRNETKEKATPYRLFPVLLSFMGGKLKLASLKQPLAENSHKACAARRGSRGIVLTGMAIFIRLLEHPHLHLILC